MLDIVDVPLRSPQRDPSQPENWLVDEKSRWNYVGSLPVQELKRFVESPPNLWLELNTPTDRISTEYISKLPPTQSLYLLHLPKSVVRPTLTTKPAFRLHFMYNGIPYRLRITDPIAVGRFTERMIGRSELQLRDVIACISLGTPFKGFHYKLVASITQPLAEKTLFTVGHSSRSIDEFIDLLREHNIEAIADVRSQPYSARFPHFSMQALQASLRGAGIRYVFLGRELGARRDEREVYENGQVRYERIVDTTLFQRGIDRVVNGSDRYRICLMCAEKDPLDCHRSVLISRHLQNYGINTMHILGKGLSETHSTSERRLAGEENVRPYQLQIKGDGFDNDSAIDRAYALREQRITFRMREICDEDFLYRVHPKVG